MTVELDGGFPQYFTLPASSQAARNRGALTLAAWIRSALNQQGQLIGYATNNGGVPTSNTRAALKLLSSPANSLQGQLRAPDAGARVDGGSPANEFLPDIWHLAACAFDVPGDRCRTMHDDVTLTNNVVAYANAATDNTVSANGAIGAEEDGSGAGYTGLLDHCFVYRRLLDPARDLGTMWHTHGAVVPRAGLLSHWRFQGPRGFAAGADVRDDGPLQEHVTPVSAPVYREISFLQPRRRGV